MKDSRRRRSARTSVDQDRKTAICGTDMHIYHWDDWAQKTIPVPMAVGHEYYGRIVDMGSEVRGFALGDRVSGEGHLTCGFCRNCRAGRRHLCIHTVGVGVNARAVSRISPSGQQRLQTPDAVTDIAASSILRQSTTPHSRKHGRRGRADTGAGHRNNGRGHLNAWAAPVVITDVKDYRLDWRGKWGHARRDVGREKSTKS